MPARTVQSASPRSDTAAGKHLRDWDTHATFEALSALRDRYNHNRYVHLPGLLSAELVREYYVKTRALQSKRVNCGLDDVSWEEQAIPPEHDLFRLFISGRMLKLVRSLIAMPSDCIPHVNCWVARYNAGEFINPHRDRAGTIQFIMCLHASGREEGGLLGLEQLGRDVAFFRLRPGDAIAFQATAVEHFTTPPLPSVECPRPTRAVAVSRYTFE